MVKFQKNIDLRSRQEMVKFLWTHFTYYTMSSCNGSTSYANDMKVYNLGLDQGTENKLYNLVFVDGAYDSIQVLLEAFGKQHHYNWQAAFNGKSGGYLVLYAGGSKQSKYKSFCTECGQRNYTLATEENNVCGHCGAHARINYKTPQLDIFTYPMESVDMYADFRNKEEWPITRLRSRVRLVQEFDRLCDDVVSEAVRIANDFKIVDEEYTVTKTRKVLVPSEHSDGREV